MNGRTEKAARSAAELRNKKPVFRIYIPFLRTGGMSERSKDFRDQAARELRKSRNDGSPAERATSKKRSAALKSLSENEDWLNGENRKRRKPTEKRQRHV
jgi:hypothetical protein